VKRNAGDDLAVYTSREEYDYIVSYLRARCKQTCAGRERYSGKNRHEPGCPVWELGLEEEEIGPAILETAKE
jgi:hypothetical protein